MHDILKGFLDKKDYRDFLKSLKDLKESDIDEIMNKKDIISFLLACYLGDKKYIKDNLNLGYIKNHDYFAFQLAVKNNQIAVMSILKGSVTEDGNKDEWFEMVRTDNYLAFKWAKGKSREWLKQNYPIFYNSALRTNNTIPKGNSEWKLEIRQLDVGQGDSALILFKKLNLVTRKYEVNKSILIDGGLGYNEYYLEIYIPAKLGKKANGTNRNLDAVIITHFDVDHCFGIAQTMLFIKAEGGGKKIIEITRAKQNQIFTKNTKFVLPLLNGRNDEPAEKNGNKISEALIKYYEQKEPNGNSNILRSYNFLGKTIWDVFGLPQPQGAPDLKFIAAENAFVREDLKQQDMVQLALDGDDNQRSAVSLIRMDGFRFYTAGDFENSRGLIEYLGSRADATDYLPIQAFLSPHHGSAENLPRVNKLFADKIKARAVLISAGENNYGHPNLEALKTIKDSEVSFAYLTNSVVQDKSQRKYDQRQAITQEKDIILQGNKFVFAGNKSVTGAKTQNKNPRGTIKVQTYQNIADVGKEKFMIKYKNTGSKTRDYFKDNDFADLKKNLLKTIRSYDEDFAKQNNKGKLEIYLSKSELQYFLDEKGKLKHINSKILSEFFANKADSDNGSYVMSINLDENMFSFEIRSCFYQDKERRTKVYESSKLAKELYERVLKIGTTLNGATGFYFDDIAEIWDNEEGKFKSISQSKILESREEDKRNKGKFFLEVKKPNGREIDVILREKENKLVRKEYHKDVREEKDEKDKHVNKVIARRIEYGSKENRKIM